MHFFFEEYCIFLLPIAVCCVSLAQALCWTILVFVSGFTVAMMTNYIFQKSTSKGALVEEIAPHISLWNGNPIEPIDIFSPLHWNRTFMRFDKHLREAQALSLHTCVFRPLLSEADAKAIELWELMRRRGPAAAPSWAKLEPYNTSARWDCEPDDVRWLVKCSACNETQDLNACDWAAADTRRCGAARAYIPPVHYGETPAPELTRCLHDHTIVTIGDCNVRSLVTFALDAIDRSAPSGQRSGALPFIELGHHLLMMRDAPYSHARYRASYFYYPEPAGWNFYNESGQPMLGDLFGRLLDLWRPHSDLRGIGTDLRSTLVLFIGGTGQPHLEQVHSYLEGGCSSSLLGCPWLHKSQRFAHFPRPRVVVKSPPFMQPSKKRSNESTNLLRERALALGFDWLNAFPSTFPVVAFLGSDPIHYDTYETSKPPGFRSGGPITLALTNRFLEEICGVLRDPVPPIDFDPLSCWHCVGGHPDWQ
jgi:hypothetical protein